MSTQIKGLTIKGLSAGGDHDLTESDTPPNAIKVWFDTDDVFEPAVMVINPKTNEETLRPEGWKKYVYCNVEYDMGFCAGRQRVKDKLRFDEKTNKWEIVALAPGEQSHIRRWPDAWNAFYEGLDFDQMGTPLEVIFPADKGFVKHLHKIGIHTVERLGGITEGEASIGGMGVLDASRKAKTYLERMKESGKFRETDAHIKALENHNSQLNEQVQAMQEQLARLTAELEIKSSGASKRKGKGENAANQVEA